MIEGRHNYWQNKFEANRFTFSEEDKVAIATSVLRTWVSLSPEDTAIFLKPELPGSPESINELMCYSAVEQRVGKMFAGGKDTITEEQVEERHQHFLYDLKQILSGHYSPEEIEEVVGLSAPGDALFFQIKLAGPDHWTTRKIRNAYLPIQTSFVAIDSSGKVTDITYKLFDGEHDAVDQIDQLLGK